MKLVENKIPLDESDDFTPDYIWYLHDSLDEFWHDQNQLLFYCGPESSGEVSKTNSINKFLTAAIPEFIVAATWEPNLYMVLRDEMENYYSRSFDFDSAAQKLEEILYECGIGRGDY